MNHLELKLKIAKYGVAIIASEDRLKGLSAVYTVGFTAINLPEIVMVGNEPLAEKTSAMQAVVQHVKIYSRDMLAMVRTNKQFEFIHEGRTYTLTTLPNDLAVSVATEVANIYQLQSPKFAAMVDKTEVIEDVQNPDI
jgi:hypothetical protein